MCSDLHFGISSTHMEQNLAEWEVINRLQNKTNDNIKKQTKKKKSYFY